MGLIPFSMLFSMLDYGDELRVTPNKATDLRRALRTLRISRPGIVIDTQFEEFRENELQGAGEFAPPWDGDETPDRGSAYSFMRQLIQGK
jgi:hypothetical protein